MYNENLGAKTRGNISILKDYLTVNQDTLILNMRVYGEFEGVHKHDIEEWGEDDGSPSCLLGMCTRIFNTCDEGNLDDDNRFSYMLLGLNLFPDLYYKGVVENDYWVYLFNGNLSNSVEEAISRIGDVLSDSLNHDILDRIKSRNSKP